MRGHRGHRSGNPLRDDHDFLYRFNGLGDRRDLVVLPDFRFVIHRWLHGVFPLRGTAALCPSRGVRDESEGEHEDEHEPEQRWQIQGLDDEGSDGHEAEAEDRDEKQESEGGHAQTQALVRPAGRVPRGVPCHR